MKKEIKEFLQGLVDYQDVPQHVSDEAEKLLETDFEEEILDLWSIHITDDYFSKKAMEFENKVDWIWNYKHNTGMAKFMEEHWESIDSIMAIVKKAIKENAKEKKDE